MDFQFRLFLQEHPNESVTAQAVAVPGVAAHARNQAAAISAVRTRLTAYLKRLDQGEWGRFSSQHDQELRPLALEVVPEDAPGQEPIPITVSLLITRETGSRGIRYRVQAPRIARLELVVRDPLGAHFSHK